MNDLESLQVKQLQAERDRYRELLEGLYGTVSGRKPWERKWPNISKRIRQALKGGE